jgi:hypothetical protein
VAADSGWARTALVAYEKCHYSGSRKTVLNGSMQQSTYIWQQRLMPWWPRDCGGNDVGRYERDTQHAEQDRTKSHRYLARIHRMCLVYRGQTSRKETKTEKRNEDRTRSQFHGLPRRPRSSIKRSPRRKCAIPTLTVALTPPRQKAGPHITSQDKQ